jgi:hypothetical protein
MNQKILQVLTVAFSVSLAGAYVYFAGKPKQRLALAARSSEIPNTVGPAKPTVAGPIFNSDLDLIPSTKSFRVVPPDISVSKPMPELNSSMQPDKISDQAIIEVLQKKSSFSIKQQSIREIAKTFSTQFKIPIIIDEVSVKERGRSMEEAITLELPSVSLRTALKCILEPSELTYVVENKALLITARNSEMIMGTKAGLIDLADDVPMPPIPKDLYQSNPTSK